MSDERNFDPKKFSDEVRDRAQKISDEAYDRAKKFSDDLHDHIHEEVHDRIRNSFRGRRGHVVGIHLGRRTYPGGMVWGVILILLGTGLLLDHMGIISIDHLVRFWPMLIVLAGVLNLQTRERRVWGFLLILGGAFLQFRQLGLPYFEWVQFWPLVFIVFGLLLMWNAIEARRRSDPSSGTASGTSGGTGASYDPRTTVNGMAVFGGFERRVTTQDFQGGQVTAVFGGIELDFRDANMQGNEATLEINTIFGGSEIRVPDTWMVSYQGAPIFGGVEDKTSLRRSENPVDPQRKILIIVGAVVFGGMEIKN